MATVLTDRDDSGEEEEPRCPVCEGPGEYLGVFLRRDYYRCPHCGMGFSRHRGRESTERQDPSDTER